MSRSENKPAERELETCLRGLDSEGMDPVGDHPTAVELARWLDGALPDGRASEMEAHLASCGECRALVLDVSSAREPVEDRMRSTSSASRRAFRWIAAAALILVSLMSFRGLTVDRRLGELGVGPWSRVTADREVLDAAVGLLDGRAVPSTPFASFSTDEPSIRAGSTDSALLMSPRWEALVGDSVVWQWISPFEAVELWVVDDREQLVLRQPIDRSAVRAQDEVQSFGPISGLGPLDPARLYAWKLNFRDADGRLLASGFTPFHRLEPHQLDSDLSAWPSFLAAAALSEAGAHGEALRRLGEVESSAPGLRRAVRTVMQRRRVPEELLDQEVTRWMRAAGQE